MNRTLCALLAGAATLGAGTAVGAADSYPSISRVTPNPVIAGSSVTVRGTCATDRGNSLDYVIVSVQEATPEDPEAMRFEAGGRATGRRGQFTATVDIPAWADQGAYWVSAWCQFADGSFELFSYDGNLQVKP